MMKKLFGLLLVVSVYTVHSYAQGALRPRENQKPGKASVGVPVIDEQPQFPGGAQAFREYISHNLKYPDAAREAGKSATIYAKFRLDALGKVEEVNILNPAGYGFDEEVTRVLKRSPRWIPAKSKGIAVQSWFQVPVTFRATR